MPGLRDIKRRLQTARSIKKITYAMKLVSTAKLKKAQEAVINTREYTGALREMIAELRTHASMMKAHFSHPLLESHDATRRIAVVIIGGSRGLCGGYNTNINKKVESTIAELRKEHPGCDLEFVVIGKKPNDYFRRVHREVARGYENLHDDPYLWPLEEVASMLEARYIDETYDAVYMIYTRFKSAISVTPVCDQLLPIVAAPDTAAEGAAAAGPGDIIFEPSAQQIFNAVVPKVLRVRLLHAALDAKASEHGSRMTAMDNATKNGNELIERLQLQHNKLRQGTITSELLDIIGGANAIE